MAKINCWEHKKCGREPGGAKANGNPCHAATETKLNGVHGGKNGGRACWVVAGTLCGGQVQGTFAAKAKNCMSCDFYKMVVKEEGSNFEATQKLLARMK